MAQVNAYFAVLFIDVISWANFSLTLIHRHCIEILFLPSVTAKKRLKDLYYIEQAWATCSFAIRTYLYNFQAQHICIIQVLLGDIFLIWYFSLNMESSIRYSDIGAFLLID